MVMMTSAAPTALSDNGLGYAVLVGGSSTTIRPRILEHFTEPLRHEAAAQVRVLERGYRFLRSSRSISCSVTGLPK